MTTKNICNFTSMVKPKNYNSDPFLGCSQGYKINETDTVEVADFSLPMSYSLLNLNPQLTEVLNNTEIHPTSTLPITLNYI